MPLPPPIPDRFPTPPLDHHLKDGVPSCIDLHHRWTDHIEGILAAHGIVLGHPRTLFRADLTAYLLPIFTELMQAQEDADEAESSLKDSLLDKS